MVILRTNSWPMACIVVLGMLVATLTVSAQTPKADVKLKAGASAKAKTEAPAKEASDSTKLREDINETIARRQIALKLPNGKSHTGEFIITHFRPNGDGPFPVVVMNHGRPNREERAKVPRQRQLLVASYWARRGFAVLVPTRIGYGELGQTVDPEAGVGRCDVMDYRMSVTNIVAHSQAAVEFAREQPWADTKRLIVMGVSYGGFGAIGASASELPGLIAAINFSGGLGGSPKERPESPCHGDGIARHALDAGKAARVPMLWLYAENDLYWGSSWPRQWHESYVKGGGKADLIMFPPVGDDGHNLINSGFALWRRALDNYILRFGIAAPKTVGAHKDTGFAKLEQIDKLPFINAKAREEGYRRFLNTDVPRAFAIADNGAWVRRSGESDAAAAALKRCRELAKRECKLYAVDDMVVWKR